jgi:hypothetical protein
MKITSTILKNIYNMLVVCEPFDKWHMPLAAQIKFIVNADPDVMGTYMYDDGEKLEHIITISTARCGFLDTVIRTMAHEMIHMSFYRRKGNKWAQHGKEFRARCHRVGKELGLDPLEL